MGYNPTDDLLYGIYSQSSTTTDDLLYSIDPSTLTTTYIGNTGLSNIQGAEFGSDGTFYSWSSGLITIDTSDASVTVISSGLSPIFQYLTFDPDNTGILYGSDQSTIYAIDTSDGSISATSYVDSAFRGLILLDQDTCTAVDDCDDTDVVCGIGVTWSGGELVLEDVVSGTATTLDSVSANFNSLTRATDGSFYFSGSTNLYQYDPCNDGTGITTVGSIAVSGYTIRAMGYDPTTDLLYGIYSQSSTTSDDLLYSIDPTTLTLTYIGNTGLTNIQGAEFDTDGTFYSWSNGLITIDTSDASVTVISSGLTSIFQYLTFDPEDGDTLYGSDQSTIYEINKNDGTLIATSWYDSAYRGFIILDQDTCTEVDDCDDYSNVVCGIGVTWSGGELILEDIVSGSETTLDSVSANFNSLTRATDGTFYFSGSTNLYKYDPCNGGTGIETVGSIAVSGYTIRAMGYNPTDDLLYGIYSQSSTTTDDFLYSIDPTTLTTTYIGNTGLSNIQGAEFDSNGRFYSWSSGLIVIDTSDASVTVISSGLSSIFQYLTFDPDDADTLYGSDQSTIYEINKNDGSITATSFVDSAFRGFIILDQNSCSAVNDCDDYEMTTTTEGPETTTTTSMPTTTTTQMETTSTLPMTTGVLCGVGVTWSTGSLILEDIVSGSETTIDSISSNFNALTRDGDGVFYISGSAGVSGAAILYKYDPCNGGTSIETVGNIAVGTYTIRGLGFNTRDGLLYGLYSQSSTSTNDLLYSIDPSTLAVTYIGDTGLTNIQGAEFSTDGRFYSWSSGLITIDTSDASVTVISSGLTEIFQYLTFDPDDDNRLYGSDQSTIYAINVNTGSISATSYVDSAFRGLILLDQDTCTRVNDCDDTRETSTTTTRMATTTTEMETTATLPMVTGVLCGVGVTWSTGALILEDIVSGAETTIDTISSNFNALTRDGDGVFYISGSAGVSSDAILYKYDPCNGGTSIETVGNIAVGTYTIRGLGFNNGDGLLYGLYSQSSTTTNDLLYSIDPSTLTVTYIGDTGLTDIQGAEFGSDGRFYSWSSGLITIDTSDASVTVISSGSSSIFQYLTLDLDDDNILYGSDQSTIYAINVNTGSITATSYVDSAFRGLILLDQDTCTRVDDCDVTEAPTTTGSTETTISTTEYDTGGSFSAGQMKKIGVFAVIVVIGCLVF